MAKEKSWSKLDHASKLERITTLWNDGMSDAQIARRLSATKGQVVGYRHTHLPNVTAETRAKSAQQPADLKAPHSQKQERKRQTPGAQVTRPVSAEPIQTLPPKPQELRMQSPKQSRIVPEPGGEPSKGFVGKMTSDWNKQCGHFDREDGRQCGFHFTVQRGKEKRCNLHAYEIQ